MILLLALGACSQSKGQDIAACQIEATKAYPDQTSVYDYYKANNYASLCMKAKGYVLTEGCRADFEVTEGCYRKPWPWE
jgi:hypothetical protein